MKRYSVRREWTVVVESWVDVDAESVEEACEIAMQSDYDEQEIASDSDGPIEISRIVDVWAGKEIAVPANHCS